jgi:hypothetical protein
MLMPIRGALWAATACSCPSIGASLILRSTIGSSRSRTCSQSKLSSSGPPNPAPHQRLFGVRRFAPSGGVETSPLEPIRIRRDNRASGGNGWLTEVTGPELRLASDLKLWTRLRLGERAFSLQGHVHCHPYLQRVFKLRVSRQPRSN